jgi:hypothetical protein
MTGQAEWEGSRRFESIIRNLTGTGRSRDEAWRWIAPGTSMMTTITSHFVRHGCVKNEGVRRRIASAISQGTPVQADHANTWAFDAGRIA